MSIKNYSRAYDPTGISVNNRMVNETHPLGVDLPQIITPTLGPYFIDSLQVRSNGVLLQSGVDYQGLVLHQPATIATAKSVNLFIKILNTTLTEVVISYQAIGGVYQDTYPVFQSFIQSSGRKLVSPIRWGDILNKPTVFTPAPHYHPYWEITGWEDLITPLAKLLQVIYAKGLPKYKAVYDYLSGKVEGFESRMNSSLANVNLLMGVLVNSRIDSVGTLRISAMDNNPSNYTDGVWAELDGGVLGVGSLSDVGTTIGLSEAISFPQPDNILLNENNAPILTDGGDYLYLDNAYPAVYGGGASFDYRQLDEQFNTLGVKGYQKIAAGQDYAAVLTADQSTLSEGGRVTFTLKTYQYDTGIDIPYYISGIGRANINYPVSGMLQTDEQGQATINLQLVTASPATDSDKLELYIGIGSGLSYTLPYTLSSNRVKSMTIKPTAVVGDVDIDSYTLGDGFYLSIDHTHFSGDVVMVTAQLDGEGEHQVSVAGVLCQGRNGGVANVVLPTTTGRIYLPIQLTQVDTTVVSNLSITVAYGGKVYAQTIVPVELFAFTAEWIDLTSNAVVKIIKDNRKCALRIRHNSKQPLAFPVSFTQTTLDSGEITPTTIGPVLYSGFTNVTQSGSFLINRKDQTVSDQITTTVYSPFLSTVKQTVDLGVSSVLVLKSAVISGYVVDTVRDATVLVGANTVSATAVSVSDQTAITSAQITSAELQK